MKKSIASIIAICSITFLSACGSPAVEDAVAETQPSAVAVATKAPVAPVSWDGTWVTTPEGFSAKISGNTVTINMVSTDTTVLYWQGTWDASAKATDGLVIESKADVAALEASLMGSTEKVKPFTYKNNELSFRFTAMGMAKIVRLKK